MSNYTTGLNNVHCFHALYHCVYIVRGYSVKVWSNLAINIIRQTKRTSTIRVFY